MKVLYSMIYPPDKGGSGAPIYTYSLLKFMEDKSNKLGIVFSTHNYYDNPKNSFYDSIAVKFDNPPIFDSQPQVRDSIAFKNMTFEQIEDYKQRIYDSLKIEILKSKYDLIHVQHGMYIGYAAALIKAELKIPYVVTLHIMELNFISEFPDPLLAMKAMVDADKIIALTNAQKNRLLNEYSPEIITSLHMKQKNITREQAKTDYLEVIGDVGIDGEKVCVCHLGIDTNQYNIMDNAELSNIHNSLNIPYSSKIVLFIGRVIGMKGILDLLEAEKIYNLNNDVYTIVIGGGDLQNQVTELAARNKFINYLGFKEQADIPYYMNYAAEHNGVLCVPSSSEGMSLVYIESMACGLRVVGCAKADMGELDFMQEPYARFADFGDPESIALNINEILKNSLQKEKIRNIVLRYNPNQMGKLVYQVYSDALEKK